jgi:hypothetical protein
LPGSKQVCVFECLWLNNFVLNQINDSMKISGLTRVYLSIVFAMVFWSLTFVWFKIVNEVYPPFTIIFLRLLIS